MSVLRILNTFAMQYFFIDIHDQKMLHSSSKFSFQTYQMYKCFDNINLYWQHLFLLQVIGTLILKQKNNGKKINLKKYFYNTQSITGKKSVHKMVKRC